MYYRCINSVLAYLYACSQNWPVSAKARVRGGRSLSLNTFESDVTNCAYVTLTFHLELANRSDDSLPELAKALRATEKEGDSF